MPRFFRSVPVTPAAPAAPSPSNPTLFQPLIRTAIVGAYGIGKTSLIQAFTAPSCGNTLPATTPTIGASVANHIFTPDSPLADHGGLEEHDVAYIVRHTIWDTAGQESYKSLVPMYTRNADVLIVAFVATVEPNAAGVNALLASTLPPIRAPQLVKGVLTKCDLVSEEVATRRRLRLAQLLRQAPQSQRRSYEIMTFCTSALESEGARDCFVAGLEPIARKKHAELENKRNSVIRVEAEARKRKGGWFGCC